MIIMLNLILMILNIKKVVYVIDLLLVVKSGDFFMDIVFPGVAGAIIFALIINSILNRYGYALW